MNPWLFWYDFWMGICRYPKKRIVSVKEAHRACDARLTRSAQSG